MELNVNCPNCNSEISLELEHVPDKPATRARLTPECIYEYTVTSSQITEYLKNKAAMYRKDDEVGLMVVPVYFKRKKESTGYAYLKVAYTEAMVEKQENDFFATVGGTVDMHTHRDPLDQMFKKYVIDKNVCEEMIRSYDRYALGYTFGMDEDAIKTLMTYTTPRRIRTKYGAPKIIMAIDAFAVIKDMLEDPATGKVAGQFTVQNVTQITNEKVEFRCTVSPSRMKMEEDPIVKEMLMGKK